MVELSVVILKQILYISDHTCLDKIVPNLRFHLVSHCLGNSDLLLIKIL